MGQLKSAEEFDYYLAVHKASGHFVKLDYGLVPPRKIRAMQSKSTESDIWDHIPQTTDQSEWRNLDCTFLKACITIGTFVTSN